MAPRRAARSTAAIKLTEAVYTCSINPPRAGDASPSPRKADKTRRAVNTNNNNGKRQAAEPRRPTCIAAIPGRPADVWINNSACFPAVITRLHSGPAMQNHCRTTPLTAITPVRPPNALCSTVQSTFEQPRNIYRSPIHFICRIYISTASSNLAAMCAVQRRIRTIRSLAHQSKWGPEIKKKTEP